MSYPPPNFNGLPVTQPQSNQIYYVKPIDYSPYSYMMPPLQPPNNYGWNIQPPPLVFPHIQNQPKMAEENSGPATNPVVQDINYTRPRSPNSTSSTESRSKKERTKPSVIPTTKFINETFDFNRKKRTRKKSKAEKLPDPQLTESVKELLKQYELNQRSLAVDVGSSETMVSQWINGTAKATGWADFEVKIRSWLNQEHKKPEKGPAFDFIDESTKLKSKFLRKSNK